MSEIRVNNITNRTGTSGPEIGGIPVVDSNSHFVVPTGRTGQRYADDGENIVRDGLVLYLDAKYSYPSATGIGTITQGAVATAGSSLEGEPYTWYDMSGYENHGQVVGAGYNSTNGGTLVFDGVNDFVRIGANQVFNSNNYTVSLWTYSTKVDWYGVFFTKGHSDTYLVDLQIWDDAGFRIYSGNNTPTSTQFGLGAQDRSRIFNVWANLVVTNNNGNYTTYINSSFYASGTYNSPIQNRPIYLGGPVEGGYFAGYFGGRMGPVLYYNRALSASEVLQNYNAHKSRFGL